MGLTQKQLDGLLPIWMRGAQENQEGSVHRAVQSSQQQAAHDAALAQLIKGKQMDLENAQSERAADLGDVKSLRELLGKDASITAGKVHIDPRMKEPTATVMLTPAQKAAETDAGKKVSEFKGGGRESAASNIGQMQGVLNDIDTGKRDAWDRTVGGGLDHWPTLQGFLAPTEKSRRDTAQNAMLSMLHDAGIPRPTQWDIQRVFGQVYDPSADDATNKVRLQNAVSKMAQHKAAMENMVNQYDKTGYATIGGGGELTSPGAARDPQSDDEAGDGGITDTQAQAAMDEAYSARPAKQVAPQGTNATGIATKTISGVTYQRLNGVWKRVQ
jgi:hypothetical protein